MKPALIAALLLFPFLAPPAGAGEEEGSFCTMDQAVDQMLSAARLDAAGMAKDLRGKTDRAGVDRMLRLIAQDQVRRKLQEGHGDKVEITWKDIYDVRGTASAWACNEGCRLYCVSSFIDAVGSGLLGTRFGRGLTTVGLALAGPPGFVMMSGLEITQKTFQCNPDTVAMALDAGATLTIMLPWCKAPGAKSLCVRAQQAAGKTALKVMGRYMGREYAIGAARFVRSEGGGEFVEVVAEHLAHHGKETATHAVTHQVHSAIMSGAGGKDAPEVPEPGAPQMGVPIGDGLYYQDESQFFQ